MCFNGGCESTAGNAEREVEGFFDICGEPPRANGGTRGRVDWWIDGWPGRQGLEQGAGWPGVLEQWTLKRLKSRAPAKGGFEVFPYWSRRIPMCVASRHGRWGVRGKAKG